MNIILSKYKASDLKKIYEKEEIKVNRKLATKIKTFEDCYYIIANSIFLLVFLSSAYAMDVIWNTPLFIYISVLIVEMASFLGIFIRKKTKIINRIRNHYIKRGEHLTHPFETYWHLICFVQTGEELNKTLKKHPNLEIAASEDKLLLYEKDLKTGLLKRFPEDGFFLTFYQTGTEEIIAGSNTLDFTCKDGQLDEILKQCDDVKQIS